MPRTQGYLGDTSGPGWSNVTEWADDIRVRFKVYLVLELWPVVTSWEESQLTVCVHTWKVRDGHGEHESLETRDRWPSRRWISLQALIMHLLHEHEAAIVSERAKELAARKRPFKQEELPLP